MHAIYTSACRKVRRVGFFLDVFEVLQQNIESGNLKIPHRERGRGASMGRERFRSSPEGQVRILAWNILTLYVASIKASLLPPTQLCCLLLFSPPFFNLPSSSAFSLWTPPLSVSRLLYFSFFFLLPSPFLSSSLPNVFLSGLRWNSKCWFNNSWSEFWTACWFSQLQVQCRRCSSSPLCSICNVE